VAIAVLSGLYLDSPRWQEDWLSIAAEIFGVAMGAALAFTIITEGVVSMALLIPSTYKWIKEKGKAEGIVEGEVRGRAEGIVEGEVRGRKSQQKRLEEAYRRFGVEVDGHLVLPRTPEVQRFLSSNESEAPDSE
jgi:hypothetical protein